MTTKTRHNLLNQLPQTQTDVHHRLLWCILVVYSLFNAVCDAWLCDAIRIGCPEETVTRL